jgi:hypothetical protein
MRTRTHTYSAPAPSSLEAICDLAWQDPDVVPSKRQLRAIRDRLELDPGADQALLTRLDELVLRA